MIILDFFSAVVMEKNVCLEKLAYLCAGILKDKSFFQVIDIFESKTNTNEKLIG